MIMRFRIGNTTNNNFYNNLRNFDNLLVEYQRGLIEIQKIYFLKILKYRVRNVMKSIQFSLFSRFYVSLLGAKALFKLFEKMKSA